MHGIVRNAIREDVLYFALPALLVFSAGLAVSARDWFDGKVGTIWDWSGIQGICTCSRY